MDTLIRRSTAATEGPVFLHNRINRQEKAQFFRGRAFHDGIIAVVLALDDVRP